MINYFKTRFVPNPDGTDSAVAINNSNAAFVHTYAGDDLTGDGTREFPFRSVYKANQKSGVSYIVFRGVINEAFSTAKTIIGDDINQTLLLDNYNPSFNFIINVTIPDANAGYSANIRYYKTIFTGLFWATGINSYWHTPWLYDFLYYVTDQLGDVPSDRGAWTFNCTVQNLDGINMEHSSSIFCKSINIHGTRGVPFLFKYCVFPSTVIFKYNGTNITQPSWVYDSKANVQLLRNAYIAAGMSSDNANALFKKDSFGNETCRIILEKHSDVNATSANIFNKYDGSGNVLDYSLNPDSANEALFASDLGGYVGCFKPAIAITASILDAPINVNSDGSDTTDAGTLLNKNSDNTIDFNTVSGQTWNRIKGNTTLVIPNGIKFNGSGSMSTDGSPFGYIFGKYQNLIVSTGLTYTDTLSANTIYKVCNTLRDIYHAIIYNDNQYLPDYFFKTDDTHLTFSLLNEDSNTDVKKLVTTPLESIDIIPYDNLTTESVTFPRFSIPMFGDCYILFHKTGATIDAPVLFSEFENDKLSYYQGYAVTNADQEFVTLSADTVNYYYAIPILKFMRIELNGHFNQNYDQ